MTLTNMFNLTNETSITYKINIHLVIASFMEIIFISFCFLFTEGDSIENFFIESDKRKLSYLKIIHFSLLMTLAYLVYNFYNYYFNKSLGPNNINYFYCLFILEILFIIKLSSIFFKEFYNRTIHDWDPNKSRSHQDDDSYASKLFIFFLGVVFYIFYISSAIFVIVSIPYEITKLLNNANITNNYYVILLICFSFILNEGINIYLTSVIIEMEKRKNDVDQTI